ncbi:MAG: thiamine pyrophosphate-binding protein [Burkholderiales bacterium]|nr:thiamine pyrophosphate-binding protein [Burkholderiales bacterium]
MPVAADLEINGAQALVRAIMAENVQQVFGLVGGKLAPLLKAIADEPRLTYTGVRHEAAATMMAAGYAAGTGRIALALGEMGPGTLNLASGLGVAYNNSLPLLAITTNQHRAAAYPHSGMFMDLDALAVTRAITKWNAVVHDPRRIPELVRRAFREAFSGRPGPVHLDVPQDVLAARCTFGADTFDLTPAQYRAIGTPRPDRGAVAAAASLLRDAKRPLIVAGGGVVASGAVDALRTLAARLAAPVLPTQMALGVVASDSPHFFGHGGIIAGEAVWQTVARADVVVSVGCRHTSWMWDERGPLVRRSHRVISINLDPSALGAPVAHEVSMQADARAALEDLIDALAANQPRPAAGEWLAEARGLRAAYRTRLDTMADEAGEVMHPAALARAVAAALPAGALAVYDGGHTTFWSNDFTPVAEARTRFHEPMMSHLGFGLPYALALQRAHPRRPVVLITGDGAFGFTMNELDTARRYGLNVIVVIHNNAAWGIIRAGQKNQGGFELGSSLEGTDYAAIARGFGCHGELVSAPTEAAGAFERALAARLPAVLDCRTRFVPHPCLPGFGAMNRYSFDSVAGVTGPAGVANSALPTTTRSS